MNTLSPASLLQLNTCAEPLQRGLNIAIKVYDFAILEGYRNRAGQEAAFASGDLAHLELRA